MLVCLDSSIVIAWMQGKEQSDDIVFYVGVSDIMRGISKPVRPKKMAKRDAIYAIASDMLIKEVWPEHHKHVREYSEFEKKKLDLLIVPADNRIIRRAYELQDQLGLKEADAIHLATAIEQKCNFLLTSDNDMLNRAEVIKNITKGETTVVKPPIPEVQLLLLNSDENSE